MQTVKIKSRVVDGEPSFWLHKQEIKEFCKNKDEVIIWLSDAEKKITDPQRSYYYKIIGEFTYYLNSQGNNYSKEVVDDIVRKQCGFIYDEYNETLKKKVTIRQSIARGQTGKQQMEELILKAENWIIGDLNIELPVFKEKKYNSIKFAS